MSAKKTLVLISIILFIAGCTQPAPETPTSPVDVNAQAKLAEAAASVSQSLEQLASIEKAVHPAAKIPPPPDPVSIGMAKLATVDWNGPIEPLVRKIAAATNYKVRVLGKPPAIPALVSISAQNTPLADILRDAAFQVEKKADIVLYPRSRVIEIRYLDP